MIKIENHSNCYHHIGNVKYMGVKNIKLMLVQIKIIHPDIFCRKGASLLKK